MTKLTKETIAADWRKFNMASSIGAWVGFVLGFAILGIMGAAVSMTVLIIILVLFVLIGIFLWRTLSARNRIAEQGDFIIFRSKVKSRLLQNTKEGTLLCFQMDYEDYMLTLTGSQKSIEEEFDAAIEGITEYYVVQIGGKALRYPADKFEADGELEVLGL